MGLSDSYILYPDYQTLGQGVDLQAGLQNDSKQFQGDTETLCEAINTLEKALAKCNHEDEPDNWVSLQNKLGIVSLNLGQQKNDAKLLKKAIDAYTNTLKVWTQDQTPFKWAASMNNLGITFYASGRFRKANRMLEKSVVTYNGALNKWSMEEQPQDWAMTQNNLGVVLQNLGEREKSTERMQAAIQAYENTLLVWREQQLPMNLAALTMANLGAARRIQARLTNDLELAQRAADDFMLVTEVFSSACDSNYLKLGEEQLVEAQALVEALANK